MDIQAIKSRFSIIGSSKKLEYCIEVSKRVAATDLSVLITGESGVGKEFFPKIIHQLSKRKHSNYIAVNCGAIPEGTIDSELFGHEKGSFTGASERRKGYFEVANGGTIFLDEVGELPLQTQVRLLRVLESKEFISVGSSKVQKTDVRIIAATNVDMEKKIQEGKFREDLFYRLNTVPIAVPPLRERREDIHILFRKFVSDFSNTYKMPPVRLSDEAKEILINYSFPGNVRQLKNLAEQISILEEKRFLEKEDVKKYLNIDASRTNVQKYTPPDAENFKNGGGREYENSGLFLKIFLELKSDIMDIKNLLVNISKKNNDIVPAEQVQLLPSKEIEKPFFNDVKGTISLQETEENSLKDNEKKLILKVLDKYRGKRKDVAKELGISERTLYRKIKDYDIQEYL